MDRVTVSICRIYVALNALHTANLSEKELEELEQNVVGIIDRATHRRTPKMLRQKPQKDSKENDKETMPAADGPEQHTVISAPSSTPDTAPHTISDTSNIHPTKEIVYEPAKGSDPVKDKPKKTEQKKRVRWDCNTCVNKCDTKIATQAHSFRCGLVAQQYITQ